jgi:serine protease Do
MTYGWQTLFQVLPMKNLCMSLYVISGFITCLISGLAFSAEVKKTEKNNFFVGAAKYTVKIKARVKYPFINDRRGGRSGAGFLIDKKRGWVLTNRHVSGHDPESLRVMFKGASYFDAEVLYTDRLLDLAVIKLPLDQIPATAAEASLECTSEPVIGANVGAFGHPFSLSFTGTRGIVSGNRARRGRSLVQTDAPINKGNSGGPLINLGTGKVIGINKSSFSKSKSEGISFAVPMVHACRVINILKKGGNPSPNHLPLAFSKKPDHDDGLVVSYLYQKQPVTWPLKLGDEILGVVNPDLKPVKNQGELLHELRGLRGHAQIRLKRKGDELTTLVPLLPRQQPSKQVGVFVSGVIIAPFLLRDDEIKNINNEMMVHHSRRASAARLAGVRKWNYLVSVDGKKFSDPIHLCRHLKKAESQLRNINMRLRRFKTQYASFTEFSMTKFKPKSVGLVGRGTENKSCIRR